MPKPICKFDFLNIPKLNEKIHSNLMNHLLISSKKLITYNELMKNFETSSSIKTGVLFVCNEDSPHPVIFQHLPLFCDYYRIPLFSLKKGASLELEKKINRKNVVLVFIPSDDLIYDKIIQLLELK